jgi:hypothetical protein
MSMKNLLRTVAVAASHNPVVRGARLVTDALRQTKLDEAPSGISQPPYSPDCVEEEFCELRLAIIP